MFKLICTVVIIIASIAIIFLKQSEQNVLKEQNRQSAVIESLEQAITLEDLRTEDLNKKKEKANSDENIEEIAREQLNQIKTSSSSFFYLVMSLLISISLK